MSLQLRDRLTVSTQQTVAASLSVWHDKVESSVRQVERQVAALRIGRTIGSGSTGEGDGGASMSNAEVQEALSTQQPSELLVKSMVDSAVRATEQVCIFIFIHIQIHIGIRWRASIVCFGSILI